MKDYSKSKIYTIKCKTDCSKIYVGSTIQTLNKRYNNHISCSNNEKYKNMLLYKNVNNNWSDWYIELYENYPCKNLNELLMREGEIIKLIGTLNKVIAGSGGKQYVNAKEKQKELRKIWKEKAKEERQKAKEETKEKRRAYHKQYYLENKKKIIIEELSN